MILNHAQHNASDTHFHELLKIIGASVSILSRSHVGVSLGSSVRIMATSGH